MPSSKLRLPTRLDGTLRQNLGVYGGALSSLSELDPWIADNKLPFFPEYTDHGPDHINEVFVTAEALIRDEAWPHVTPEDVAVLMLGILLHDCAMHLNEEGFVALLKRQEWAKPVVPAIDTASWRDLWDEFLREAARFDGKKLKRLFGDTDPIKPPRLDALAMTKRDRLLIGEFLRRHHPRLAHEIALQGVPGPETTPLKLQNISSRLAELAGLVARSHGMPLRAAVDLLPNDERRETRNVHVPFLMSVLRIADYLQIHAERAPAKLLQVRSLKSPVSAGEWRKHHAIETIHNHHDDPEALYVKALPDEAVTYVGLKRLFASIQQELDDVWAVLGEVYGRVGALSEFGIVVRRLRSNLDDEKAFARTVSYVPEQIEFRAAGVDLLKLLIQPLYGDEPEIGVRELLQNAIDACREFEDCMRQHPDVATPERVDQEADVVVATDADSDGHKWLTVSDRGIGMTPEVIKDYFLTVGASFRKSDAWQRQHMNEDGTSRVLRSGRFGIGVLAAFLLGDMIEVTTRHLSQTRGASFCAGVDDEVIELRHVDCPVGTRIRIKMSQQDDLSLTHKQLYWLKRPSVVYKMSTPTVAIVPPQRRHRRPYRELAPEPRRYLPGCGEKLPPTWRRISWPGFDDIQWSYWDGADVGSVLCNGIRVSAGRGRSNRHDGWDYSIDLDSRVDNAPRREGQFALSDGPCVSVFDPDGRLPLNLQRDRIFSRDVPFVESLRSDIWMDFVGLVLALSKDDKYLTRVEARTSNYGGAFGHPGVHQSHGRGMIPRSPFLQLSNGWSFLESWFHQRLGLRAVLLVSDPSAAGACSLQANEGLVVYDCGSNQSTHRAWFRLAASCGAAANSPPLPIQGLRCDGARIILRKKELDELRKHKNRRWRDGRVSLSGQIARDVWVGTNEEWSDTSWVVLRTGECPPLEDELLSWRAEAPRHPYVSLAKWYLGELSTQSVHSDFSRVWADVVKYPVIPFDIDERRRVLAHAYERLALYITAHEELMKSGITKRPMDADDEDADEA